jgi:hypothetical protein
MKHRSVAFLCFIGVQWFNDFMLRKMREYGFYHFTHATTGDFRGWENNYNEYPESGLPIDHVTQPDFILVDSAFFVNRRRVFGHDAMYAFIKRKSRNFSIPVIGIDHCDVVLSKFHPKDIDCFNLILKGQGLPKDRELMNWEIGVRWGLNRKERIRRIRFDDWVLSPAQIDKFKLSFDLGSAAYCDIEVKPLSSALEWYDVFFVGSFDSLNRLEGLKICGEHFRTLGWLVKLPDDHPIVGIEDWKADPKLGRKEDRDLLTRESNRLYRENRKLFRQIRIPSDLYKFLAQFCKIMPAFSGIGELGPRHYQALEFDKALVCEDVSYIETIFTFQDGKNCVFVADRLGDLEEKVRCLLKDASARHRIASTGFSQLQETYRDGNAIFEGYFLRHLGIDP